MKRMAVINLCLCGIMIALHIVLELFCTIRIGNDYKVTFATLPFIIIALLCGPVEGLATGLLGTLLSQLLTFGWTQSTPFWIIPGALCGLVAGLVYKIFRRKPKFVAIMVSVVISMFVFIVFNWIASYFDGVVIYKYLTVKALVALIPIRVLIGVGLMIIYTAVSVPLCKGLQGRIKGI